PGLFGHGVAETEEDALALIGEAARRLPPEVARFFCPLREANLYRKLMKAGCRAIKVMNLMTLGLYEPPDEVWMPSVLY
ncbi:MAG: GNAT family N-acetyltransferase, partial [Thermodesulfobacteriota bacterium]